MPFPKIRWMKLASGLVVLVLGTVFVTDQFSIFEIRALKSQIAELEREKLEFKAFADRLSVVRRVAQISVIEQDQEGDGGPATVLHWQQIGADGLLGPVEVVQVRGTQVYIEAMVAKFEFGSIGRGEPGRATNLARFRRAFGDAQAPSTGYPLDQTAPLLKDSQPEAGTETGIWTRFWEIAESPRLAREYGIRVVQCEAPSARMKPGQIWEVNLESAGGLSLRKIGDRALPSSRAAMHDEI